MGKNLKDSKLGRGINFVALDNKTYAVKLIETFDTYIEGKQKIREEIKRLLITILETFFLRTLKLNLNDGDIAILASFDEVTYG